jgi:hypothetical protein
MRPRGTLVFLRAARGGGMVVRDSDMLKSRSVSVEVKHRVAGNRAPGLGNMCRRRRILVSRQPDTARIDDGLFAGGCHPRNMTVGA